jgi:S-DNA-T family DNA segregation ATPase FtsK/SpoIIIE
MSLPERNVVIGGEPGAGKSVALSMLVATAALDPHVRLSLFDAKLVELAVWREIAERFVGGDPNEAIRFLKELREEMEERYRYLLERKRRKITREDSDFPLHLVAIDELALYTATAAKAQREEFSNLLRDLVSRGRAAGIIVVAATQRPSSDIVPTSLRDLFGFRWALRCSTPQASDTILGQGWATQGYSASNIDAADRGVGFLLHEGLIPIRLRAFYLSDDDLAAIAARALQLRSRRIA